MELFQFAEPTFANRVYPLTQNQSVQDTVQRSDRNQVLHVQTRKAILLTGQHAYQVYPLTLNPLTLNPLTPYMREIKKTAYTSRAGRQIKTKLTQVYRDACSHEFAM